MLHVGLNLVFLVPGETGGMEVAARELVPALVRAAPGVRFTAFVGRDARDADLGVDRVVLPIAASNRIEWVRGEQLVLPRAAARAGCDLVHSLGSTAPATGAFRRITTLHDLNYKLVPEAHFGLRGLGMRVLVPLAARRSHRLIVDAESTRRDLVEHLGTPAGKVDVVPLGVTQAPPAPPTEGAALRASLGLGERPVVLSVSAKRPHKNLPRLLRAIAAIPAELRALAGELGIGGQVAFPAWVSAEDLEGLYALAACFVFPSLYEGFGLPVLEAMRRGVPVATSDRSSLPEVAGDAALYFDPTDVDAIRGAVERLLGEPRTAERLVAAGRERAAAFTWGRTAALTLASYERALAS